MFIVGSTDREIDITAEDVIFKVSMLKELAIILVGYFVRFVYSKDSCSSLTIQTKATVFSW